MQIQAKLSMLYKFDQVDALQGALDMSEPMVGVHVSEAQTLTDPVNSDGQVEEHVGSHIRPVMEADQWAGEPLSGLGTGEFDGRVDDTVTGCVQKEGRETEVAGREFDDLETEEGCLGAFSSEVVNCGDSLAGNEGSKVVVSKTGNERGLVMEANEGLLNVVEVSENQSAGELQDKGTVDYCQELCLNGKKGSVEENFEYEATVQVDSSAVLKDQEKRSAGLISMHPDLEQGDNGVSESPDLLHDSVDHMDTNLYNIDDTSRNEQLNVGTHATELKYLDGIEREAMDVDREFEVTNNGSAVGTMEYSGDDSNISTEGDDSERKPSPSRLEFNVSDLVWGKVRSHPWWPGQIFEPSAASNKAKKYFKKDCYLIAYFGDQTFAWNDASRIKNFQTHFSQMEKQSNSEDFHHAVDNALDEVSRRIEYSLACSCIPKEVYTKLKTQIIINAGIADESRRRDGGDKFLTATSFDPIQLIDHVKSLALSPLTGFNRLDLVIARAQLMIFYRAKGYPRLPEYKMHGVCEDDPQVEEKLQEDEAVREPISDVKSEEETQSGKGLRSQDNPLRKRKNAAGVSMRASKKERTLSDLMTEHSAKMEADEKQMTNSSGQKRKAVVGFSDDSSGQHGNSSLSSSTSKSQLIKQNFRVGDSIRRAANQLLASTPILKCSNGVSQIAPVKNSCKRKTFHKSLHDKLIQSEVLSPVEMLSQLYATARNPTRETSLPHFTLCFLSEYQFSMSHDSCRLQDRELCPAQTCGAESGGRSTKVVSMHDEMDLLGDCYWTDRLIESIPDEQLQLVDQNGTGEFLSEPLGESGFPNFEPQFMTDFSAYMISDQENTDRAYGQETFKPMSNLEDSYKEDVFPTELILEFTNLDSVPSEAKLNKIFSRFGSLLESETEVLKESGRAKVVFKRHADAETACNSAGKYNIFGQSDVVYRLKYMPPPSVKGSPHATKRGRTPAANVGGNGT